MSVESAAPATAHGAHDPHAHGVVEHGHHGHGDVAHQFDDAGQQREAAMLGMWSFLATEVLFFGGLFTAYVVYRTMAPVQVQVASHHLNVILGAVNTGVLLVSSLLVALAVREAHLKNAKNVTMLLAGTIALGAVFLAVKAVEWNTDWREGLVPFFGNWDWNSELLTHDREKMASMGVDEKQFGMHKMFFVLYFFMTGLHGIHVVIGLGLFAVVIALVKARQRRGANYQNLVEVTGLYWHFVDIVWVFLYPLMYLIDPGTGGGGGH
jgi:cytochrome c oxidase subunit 3